MAPALLQWEHQLAWQELGEKQQAAISMHILANAACPVIGTRAVSPWHLVGLPVVSPSQFPRGQEPRKGVDLSHEHAETVKTLTKSGN